MKKHSTCDASAGRTHKHGNVVSMGRCTHRTAARDAGNDTPA